MPQATDTRTMSRDRVTPVAAFPTQPPSAFTIVKPFQVALLWKFVKGDPMRAGYIDGEMEISIDMDVDGGDWSVTDLWITVDNGKVGSSARGENVNLSADDDECFYLLVRDAIDHQYATRIEDWVQDELAEARYSRDAA